MCIFEIRMTFIRTTEEDSNYNHLEKMTVSEFVYSKDDKKQREILKDRFKALCDSIPLAKPLTLTSSMSDCLMLDEHSQLFSALKSLTQIQNDIIETALCIACESNSLSLFVKSADQVAIPEAHFTQIKSEMLISLKEDIGSIIVQE